MNPLDELFARLEEETRACVELCELSQRKQRALVTGDAGELETLGQAEQAMLAAVSRCEARRREVARQVAQSFGLGGDPTVSQLARHLPGDTAAALRERQRRVRSVLDELAILNGQNEGLIHQSIAFVNFSLSTLSRSGGTSTIYDSSGGQSPPIVQVRLIDREG